MTGKSEDFFVINSPESYERMKEIERTFEHPPYTYPDAHNHAVIFTHALNEALKAKSNTIRSNRCDRY